MNEVLNAYDRLIDVADRGEIYTVDQVLNPPYPALCQADTVFGRGFDIERIVTVPDIVEGQTIEATAKLRVIKTAANGLYLRTWLVWTPSNGHEHKSFASYEIDREAAEQLASTVPALTETGEPSEEDMQKMPVGELMGEVFSILFDMMDTAGPYKAQWYQMIPGENLDFDDDASLDFAERHYEHHQQVIIGLGGTDSPVTCMLSYMEIGEVGPQELVVLALFVVNELDASVLV